LLFSLTYIVIGIIEVNKSIKIKSDNTKVFWTICFLAFPAITGLFYLVKRKNI